MIYQLRLLDLSRIYSRGGVVGDRGVFSTIPNCNFYIYSENQHKSTEMPSLLENISQLSNEFTRLTIGTLRQIFVQDGQHVLQTFPAP